MSRKIQETTWVGQAWVGILLIVEYSSSLRPKIRGRPGARNLSKTTSHFRPQNKGTTWSKIPESDKLFTGTSLDCCISYFTTPSKLKLDLLRSDSDRGRSVLEVTFGRYLGLVCSFCWLCGGVGRLDMHGGSNFEFAFVGYLG